MAWLFNDQDNLEAGRLLPRELTVAQDEYEAQLRRRMSELAKQ